MHRLNDHPTLTICPSCQIANPNTNARPLTAQEIEALEPPDRCAFCGEHLLEAGRVKAALEKLGFTFVTHANWSAWMRSRPLCGAFDQTDLAVSAVDFLVRRDDWHAPLDSEDGPVILKRCATWPLVQPEAGAKIRPPLRPYLGECSRPFHWVQEHEAIPAGDVLAMISLLQCEGA